MRTYIKIVVLALFISFFSFRAFAGDDHFNKCGEARNLILCGLELYLIDHMDAAPESFEKIINTGLVEGEYLSAPQSCPSGGTFSYSFKPAGDDIFPRNAVTSGGKRYILEINCSVHGVIDVYFAENEKKKFAMPSTEKAGACISNMKTIKGALELYYMDKNADARSMEDLLKNGYLKCNPTCYSNGKYELKKRASGFGAASCDVECTVHGNLEKIKL